MMKGKKILSIIGLAGMLLLTACSNGNSAKQSEKEETEEVKEEITPETIEVGKAYTINDDINVTLAKIQKSIIVEPLLGDRQTYYMDNGTMPLDVILLVENISEKELALDELIPVSAKDIESETEYECSKFEMEVEDNTSLSADSTIKPGETARVHCELSVSKDGTNYMVSLGEDKEYQIEYSSSEYLNNNQELPIDSPVGAEGFASITLKNVYYTPKLEPANPGVVYNYYAAEGDDQTLIIA